ncbi:hypothetical protein [Actinopolymorpha pittospori]|uniref:Uncharacterized protein n=1 Tax=Actinopolymorpha pittospori TaxID=648752 RepID=A0A927RMJ6_9ACTN|nr:hypothetical protein [Actinopolymorpha pittospori]MBE1608988.1 hypothetical protein [Actinopolymorpha pittospori]
MTRERLADAGLLRGFDRADVQGRLASTYLNAARATTSRDAGHVVAYPLTHRWGTHA